MQPVLRLLDEALIERILDEARDVLATAGVEIHNPEVLDLLADRGVAVDRAARRARFGADLLERVRATAPGPFALYDVRGERTHDFGSGAVHFAPGSSAIRLLDPKSGELRPPTTADYVRYAKLVAGLPHLAAQATAFVPADVPPAVSDSYRLFLSLLYGEKPVVTGAFTGEAFAPMHAMQVAVRGSESALRARPLALFTCCPTSPLAWSAATSQNLVDCARAGVPVEIVAVPLAGFLSPVSLAGTLIQHTAENGSGLAIHQLAAPGAPVLWGSSAAIFDIRGEIPAMGAVETMMLACGASEIGHCLGLPTQAYLALSDAKALDAQAGAESAVGAVLAALSGVDSVSGPGLLALDNGFSLEKLVFDDEACGMAQRLRRGIALEDDFPARALFSELLREKHLLIADHTRRRLRAEIAFPGPVIDRSSEARWREDGSPSLLARAAQEVERRVSEWTPSRLPGATLRELELLMESAARQAGMESLPERAPCGG